MSVQVTSSPSTGADARGRRLESWKEIASYLGRDVTTVRRWEKREGLPVYRLQHSRLGSLYAYTAELDTWRNGRIPEAATGGMGANQAPETVRRVWTVIALAALGLVLVGGSAWFWRKRTTELATTADSRIRSLAVLPTAEVAVTGQERNRLVAVRTVLPEVYESYLKGRYYFNQRTGDALNKSIASFQQAIARDSGYALAYSGLADAYAMLGFRGGFPSKDALSRAKTAALKAIELDETLAEPHASLAFLAETHEWDWATAEREYKRDLELNPREAQTHNWYAGYLMYVGRFDDGISEAKRARDLDPLSLPINNPLAGSLLAGNRLPW